jgi:hypothetical protein
MFKVNYLIGRNSSVDTSSSTIAFSIIDDLSQDDASGVSYVLISMYSFTRLISLPVK